MRCQPAAVVSATVLGRPQSGLLRLGAHARNYCRGSHSATIASRTGGQPSSRLRFLPYVSDTRFRRTIGSPRLDVKESTVLFSPHEHTVGHVDCTACQFAVSTYVSDVITYPALASKVDRCVGSLQEKLSCLRIRSVEKLWEQRGACTTMLPSNRHT